MKSLSAWIIFSTLAVSIVHASFIIRNWSPWKTGTDYSKQSDKEIFQKVLNKPIPNGVSNLKIVARSYFIKSWCWMSFSADDSAMKSILNGARTTDISASEIPSMRPSAADECDAIDKAKVRWDEIQNIERPEYFIWDTLSSSKFSAGYWFGYFVVDRKRHLVFAVAQRD